MKINYHIDKPKTSEQEDLLGYTKFLDQVFAYIEYFLSQKDSNIIGLAANWGDGKTTIINFLKERIKSKYKNNNAVKYVFNIEYFKAFSIKELKHFWAYGVLTLAAALTFYINYKDNIVLLIWIWIIIIFVVTCNYSNWKKSLKKIKNSLFLETDYIILDFTPWATKDENQVIQEFLKMLSDKIDLADGSDDFKKYIKAILKYKNIDLEIFTNDDLLNTLYERLKISLEKSNKKIIVFIDDMDRMTGREIYCLLKLVKVVANFPNTLYILSYNKDYVENELKQTISYKPEEYLEKIITNEFRLPNIKSTQIIDILMSQIDKIVGTANDNYDRNAMYQFLEKITSEYIPNIRKAYRVLNMFNFHYNLYAKAGVMINIADLLNLIIIKVFNLNLYNRIWDEKTNIFRYHSFKTEEEKTKHNEKYIIGYIERNSLTQAETDILNNLFNSLDFGKYDVKRLRTQNHFDLYFSYEIASSQISKIKYWLITFKTSYSEEIILEYNETQLSDMQDLMYSNLYYQYRDTNYALGLMELMIRYPKLAKDLYVKNTNFYFNNIEKKYVHNLNNTQVAQFIDKNKSRCEINLLEWLLFDCFFYDGSSQITPSRILSEELEQIKVSVQEELRNRLAKCNILDIYSAFTIERLISTYGFNELVKEKFIQFLEEDDTTIVRMLHQFTSVGHASTIGTFYNLYIIDKIYKLGIANEYKQRLLKIKNNETVMTDSDFINYYASIKELGELSMHHIIDKSIELIEKYTSSLNVIDNK